MKTLKAVISQDAKVVTAYFLLIGLIQLLEKANSPEDLEKLIYVIGSVIFAEEILRSHWEKGDAQVGRSSALRFPVLSIAVILVGFLVGIAVGVNVKFLLGMGT